MHAAPAGAADVEGCCAVITECRSALQARGLFQWDEQYPSRAFFEEASVLGNLLALFGGPIVRGVAVLDGTQPPEWSSAAWQYGHAPFLVIHAFAVSPSLQARGHGTLLLAYCEQVAAARGAHSIRIDSFPENAAACRFWERHGYRFRGEVRFASKPAGHQRYHCYEKRLP